MYMYSTWSVIKLKDTYLTTNNWSSTNHGIQLRNFSCGPTNERRTSVSNGLATALTKASTAIHLNAKNTDLDLILVMENALCLMMNYTLLQYRSKGLQHYTCVKRVYHTHISHSVHAVSMHLTRKYSKLRVITRV